MRKSSETHMKPNYKLKKTIRHHRKSMGKQMKKHRNSTPRNERWTFLTKSSNVQVTIPGTSEEQIASKSRQFLCTAPYAAWDCSSMGLRFASSSSRSASRRFFCAGCATSSSTCMQARQGHSRLRSFKSPAWPRCGAAGSEAPLGSSWGS